MRSASASSPRPSQDVRDLALGDRDRAHIAQALVDRQLLLGADAQRLRELAAAIEDVRDLALGDRDLTTVVQGLEDRESLFIATAGLDRLAKPDQPVGVKAEELGTEVRLDVVPPAHLLEELVLQVDVA